MLPNNPTYIFKEELNIIVKDRFKRNVLTKIEKNVLAPGAARVPVMYYLPKVHKNLLQPPGRSIISVTDSISSKMGCYIDNFLQPLVISTLFILKLQPR